MADNDWLDSCLQSIDKLADLPDNWDSYGGKAVDPESISEAKTLLSILAFNVIIDAPSVCASPDGNVALTWMSRDGKRELDIEVLNGGRLDYAYLEQDDA